jgi:hypothetical protein
VESVSYRIQDDKKAEASAVIRVQTSPTAPLHAPVAVDDRMTLGRNAGQDGGGRSRVEKRLRPDGVAEDLKISLPDGNQNARRGTCGNVVVTLVPQDQLIPYTVTDIDGQTATAVMWIPGQGLQYPTLSKTDVVEMTAGNEITLGLAGLRQGPGRTQPRITVADKIRSKAVTQPTSSPVTERPCDMQRRPSTSGPGSVTFEVTDGSRARMIPRD